MCGFSQLLFEYENLLIFFSYIYILSYVLYLINNLFYFWHLSNMLMFYFWHNSYIIFILKGGLLLMKNKISLKKIGSNIQHARLKTGLTQDALAEKCGVSAKYISAIERGISSGSISLIIDICNILDVTPNYIFNGFINNSNDCFDVLPAEISTIYLKLKDDNKSFVNQTINHLYSMQIKR